jgi:hypothetical protein
MNSYRQTILQSSGFIFLAIGTLSSGLTTSAAPWESAPFPLESDPSRQHAITAEEHYRVFRMAIDPGRPTCYQLYAMNDPKKVEVATLWIDGKGRARIEQQAFREGTNKLTLESAKKRFGEPRRYGQIAIFDLVGQYWQEPNVFHLELLFDGHKTASEYLIRGHGILPGDFLKIDIQKSGKS